MCTATFEIVNIGHAAQSSGSSSFSQKPPFDVAVAETILLIEKNKNKNAQRSFPHTVAFYFIFWEGRLSPVLP
jgi:hypothetical protein